MNRKQVSSHEVVITSGSTKEIDRTFQFIHFISSFLPPYCLPFLFSWQQPRFAVRNYFAQIFCSLLQVQAASGRRLKRWEGLWMKMKFRGLSGIRVEWGKGNVSEDVPIADLCLERSSLSRLEFWRNAKPGSRLPLLLEVRRSGSMRGVNYLRGSDSWPITINVTQVAINGYFWARNGREIIIRLKGNVCCVVECRSYNSFDHFYSLLFTSGSYKFTAIHSFFPGIIWWEWKE